MQINGLRFEAKLDEFIGPFYSLKNAKGSTDFIANKCHVSIRFWG